MIFKVMKVMGNSGRKTTASIPSTSSNIPITKPTQTTEIKILTRKEMFQRLAITFAEVESINLQQNAHLV